MNLSLGAIARLDVGARVVGDDATIVRRVRCDSREIEPGDLFVALADDDEALGRHVTEAERRGAIAAIARVETTLPTIVTDRPGRFLALAAELLEGNPTRSLVSIGITGTNGKTTTTHLIEQALLALGERPALIGTGILRGPGFEAPSLFTTPFGDAVSGFARRALDAGATHLVMEVSSHALDQHRADGVAFAVAGFTNLTRDHLDYHTSMDAYGIAKSRFFTDFAIPRAVIHVGDAFGRALADRSSAEVFRVAIDDAADIVVEDARFDVSGIEARIRAPSGSATLTSPLVGRHNLENLLVAIGCLLAIDVPFDDAIRALADARGAPGRLERVDARTLGVFVDYAHSPDAVANVLSALRPLGNGRLIVVFGCGGDRDRGKRPEMARAACEGADLVVVTSDNPRTESPDAIIAEIVAGIDPEKYPALDRAGFAGADRGYFVDVDRRDAIAFAIASARPGDSILLAGKGNEDYQIIGTTKHPFDDRVEAKRALVARGEAA